MFKVLLVEDEEMIRRGLRYTFDWTKTGCIVAEEAENGEAGLEAIRSVRPDIVITDLNMPLLSGLQMIERASEEEAGSLCSYIILSGYDEFQLAKEAIRLGVTEYLLKPVEEGELEKALERAKQQVELKRKYAAIAESAVGSGGGEGSAMLLELPRKSSYYVGKMIEYVRKHYSHKIGMNDLVEALGVSAAYMQRMFKQETSYTFNDFLNRYRIQRAIDMLKSGNEKIYNVATEVGFSDYKYFISTFKKYVQCTPSQFQERFGYRDNAGSAGDAGNAGNAGSDGGAVDV